MRTTARGSEGGKQKHGREEGEIKKKGVAGAGRGTLKRVMLYKDKGYEA